MTISNENEISNIGLKDNSNISKLTIISYTALLLASIWLIIDSVARIIEYKCILMECVVNPIISSIISFSIGISFIFTIILYITSMIFFIIWFYKVYSNIQILSPDEVKHSKLMAIFSFILPIFNFYKPYLIAKEIIRELNRAKVDYSIDNLPLINKSIIKNWWILNIIYNISFNLFFKFSGARSLEEALTEYIFTLIVLIIGFLSILFTMNMIKQISSAEKLVFEKKQNNSEE